jgi:hypothetical protein
VEQGNAGGSVCVCLRVWDDLEIYANRVVQFVRKAIRNQGNHDFLLSRALRNRPKHITKGGDRKISSSDNRVRCVNPLDWTVEDWTNELIRT